MKSAAIYLHGLPGIDKPEAVKTIIYQDEDKLREELKKLQLGYCEGEKPTLQAHTKTVGNKTVKVIDCYSEADFYYVAMLGFRIKESAGKPVEQL